MTRRSLPHALATATATTARNIACWPIVALLNLICPAVDDAQAYDDTEES